MLLDVYVIVAATDDCGCVEGDWPDEDVSEVFVGLGNELCLPSILNFKQGCKIWNQLFQRKFIG